MHIRFSAHSPSYVSRQPPMVERLWIYLLDYLMSDITLFPDFRIATRDAIKNFNHCPHPFHCFFGIQLARVFYYGDKD